MRLLRSKWLWVPVSTIVALVVAVVVVFNLTPYPGAMLTRFVFDRGSSSMLSRNAQYQVPDKVTTTRDVDYLAGATAVGRGDPGDTLLDVYVPAGTAAGAVLPTIVWVHGGGWVSGDKADASFYYQQLAARGLAVVALNYSRAPQRRYPTAINQLNSALGYLATQGARLHVDARRLVLAGDSAGAQLSSQLAAIVTNPQFAAKVGIVPAIAPEQLRGIALNCGVYDARALDGDTDSGASKILSWGVSNTLWAYGGNRTPSNTLLDQMSTINNVTKAYPRVWISAGNDDPLTARQTIPFVEKLKSLGVPPQTLVYGADEPLKLGHEFQFELGTEPGRRALNEIAEFARSVTS